MVSSRRRVDNVTRLRNDTTGKGRVQAYRTAKAKLEICVSS